MVLFAGPLVSLISQHSFAVQTFDNRHQHGSNTQANNFDPDQHIEPVIQIYAARTWGVKGAVAVHTWISTKRAGADHYTSYQIIGWRHLYGNRSPLVVTESRIPKQSWYGKPASLLLDLRGDQYQQTIDDIEQAIVSYPYLDTYTTWPGPNSNTFTAHVARLVPALGLDLPATAIGKDYRSISNSIGSSPSRTGVQASLFGLLGVTVGFEEGLELNILSLNFELDLFDLAIE